MSWLKDLWERVAKNWHTSVVAIIAGGVIVLGWFNVVVTGAELVAVLGMIEAIILLFAKD